MAPWIKVGQKIELRVDAFPDKAIEGEIARISPAVTQQTTVNIANPEIQVAVDRQRAADLGVRIAWRARSGSW